MKIIKLFLCLFSFCLLADLSSVKADEYKTSELINSSFISKTINIFPDYINYSFNLNVLKKNGLTSNDIKYFKKTLKKTSKKELIFAAVLTQLIEDLSENEIDELLLWLNSNIGQKFYKTHTEYNDFKDFSYRAKKYSEKLTNILISAKRKKLLNEYIDIFKMPGLTLDTKIYAIESRKKLARFLFLKNSFKKDLTLKKIVENFAFFKNQEKLNAYLEVLYLLRDLKDEELEKILDFFKTKTGQKFILSSNSGLIKSQKKIMDEFFLAIKKELTPKRFSFKEENFKFKLPLYGNWFKKPPYKTEAKLVLRSNLLGITTFIFAHKNIQGFDSSYENMVGDIKNIYKSGKNFSDLKDLEVNGCKGKTISFDFIKNKETHLSKIWFFKKNGYIYTLRFITNRKNRVSFEEDLKKVIKSFNILDDKKVFPTKNRFQIYNDKKYGISIDLTGKNWGIYRKPPKDLPSFQVAGENNEYLFFIVPYCHENEKVSDFVTHKTMLNEIFVKYPDDILSSKDITWNNMKGKEFRAKRKDNGSDYVIRVVKGDKFTYIFALYFKNKFTKRPDETLLSLYKTIKIDEPQKTPFKKLTEYELKRFYDISFSFGENSYNENLYMTAFNFFKKAYKKNRTDEASFTWALSSISATGNNKETLNFFKQNIKNFEGIKTNLINSWHAWLLKKNNQKEESSKIYKKIFATGYREESDFIDYIAVLCGLKKYKEAETEFLKYLQSGKSLNLQLELAYVYYLQKNYAKALEYLDKVEKENQFDPGIIFEKIRNLRVLEKDRDVISLCNKLIKKGHESELAYYYKGESEYYLKWYKKALASLKKSLEFTSTGSNKTENFIKQISAKIGKGYNASVKNEIPPVDLPDSIRKSLITNNNNEYLKNYNAYYDYIIYGIEYYKNGFEKETLRKRIKILDSAAVSKFSTLKISFNSIYTDICVNSLNILNEKGEVVSKANKEDFYLMDDNSSGMATYEKVLNIPVPDLKPGYFIELTSTKKSKRKYHKYSYEKYELAKNLPINFSAAYIKGDLAEIAYKFTGDLNVTKNDKFISFSITKPKVYSWEPFSDYFDNFNPVLWTYTSGLTWEKESKDYFEKISKKLVLTDKIKTIAKNITKDIKGPIEKYRAITKYVQKNITYKAIEFGVRGQIPNSPEKVLKNGYGDCKDHAVLLSSLLKSIGFESYPFLIRSIGKINPDVVSSDQFNHVINATKINGEFHFVDATIKGYDTLISPPPGSGQRYGLIVDDKTTSFLSTGSYNNKNYKIAVKRDIKSKKDNNLYVNEKIVISGYPAYYFRNSIKKRNPAEYVKWGQNFIEDFLKSAEVEKVLVSNIYIPEKDLKINLEYKIPLNKNKGKKLSIPSSWADYFLRVPHVNKRKNSVRIFYPINIVIENKIFETSSFKPSFKEHNKEIKNGFGRYSYKENKKKNAIIQKLNCYTNSGVFKNSDYIGYRNFFDEPLDLLEKEVSLIKN